ncbi:sensor histidine kinase [Paenibacillus sp. XY044]|uniref:cache domain-containing sensor histidine kinase n=1 Tax=Paenibacillus sp. XY044 TaxID=2026089 RepID=UPI000B995C48|nr:sensor histidine kinase [Paenibacillus sp. XY044]OZB92316.1 hypothetical protein CJP46_25655 [Paenibacillus sp. XY044]
MRRSLAAIKSKLTGIGIVRKMMISYICIICLPVIAFGFYYYHQISGMLIEKIAINHRQTMQQAYNNLNVSLTHYESLYKFVQTNPFIVDYLDGEYNTDAESVFNYLSYIYPQVEYLVTGDSRISNIILYKFKSNVLHIPNQIVDASDLEPDIREAISKLKPDQGIWINQMDGMDLTALCYYQVLYDRNYTDQLGIMEITVSAKVLQNFMNTLRADSSWEVYLQNQQGEFVQPVANSGANAAGTKVAAGVTLPRHPGRSAIFDRLDLESLGLEVVAFGKKNEMFRDIKTKEAYLAAMIILLLLGLSFAYFMLASSIAKRTSQLARHMRTVGNNNLKMYPKPGDMDEIGFLTASYNAMVKRIEELIENVHRAEALRKEAAFRALQAQVRPHFLYNTLETIRMMAVAKNVPEVAEIAYSFGQLMRYSLSPTSSETKLSQELEMVGSYLDIHRIRMKDRLQYKIEGTWIAENVKCPRFILQPVVENCIVHGVSKVRRPTWINVAVSEDEEFYIITIEDNGGGIEESMLNELRIRLRGPFEDSMLGERGSIGLRNVLERIHSYYGGRSRLEIDSTKGTGTMIRVFLNKQKDEVD